jgi:hypothetical protein
MCRKESTTKTRFQILLHRGDSEILHEYSVVSGLTQSELAREIIQQTCEAYREAIGSASGLAAPSREGVPAKALVYPAWWERLCDVLEGWQREGRAVETKTGVRNQILKVDRIGGSVTLMSDRSRSGHPRTIDVGLLSVRDATRHGVIVRVLRNIADSVMKPGEWHGPFRVSDLLVNCLNENQDWPPEDRGVYLVSRRSWNGEPDKICEPLYVGSTTGRSPRFCTRVGDLVADMFGFYGTYTGHSSGGIKLYRFCREQGVHPGDLFLSWYSGEKVCPRCHETRWYDRLQPPLNGSRPPMCRAHSDAPASVDEGCSPAGPG